MKQMKNKILTVFLFLSGWFIYSQTSIWQDHNPYSVSYKENDIIMVHVQEQFSISMKGEWGYSDEKKRVWNPDTVNFEFLRKSSQNKTASEKNVYSIKSNDGVKFKMPARITGRAQTGVYQIEGTRQINISGKPVRIRLTGMVSGRDIQKYAVQSQNIVDLNINIEMKITPPKDNSVQMKQTGEGEERKSEAALSDDEKERYKLEQIRQILGAL